MSRDLRGSTVLITGVAGGIGRALLAELASGGARVVGVGRGGGWAGPLAMECSGFAPRPVFIEADVSSDGAWGELITALNAREIGIDVIVHNAGATHPGPIGAYSSADISRMIGSNFSAVVFGTNAFLPYFRARGHGHIIAIGSLGGVIPMPFEALYSATKFAVRGFMLSLHEELRGSGISVTLISPGPVRTKMLDREAETDSATLTFATRILPPGAVARAVHSAILRPRREISLPMYGGFFSSLLNLSGWIFRATYPMLDRLGRRGKRRYGGSKGA